MSARPDFARLLGSFFTSHLMQQRRASRHTVASYRDTFRLLVLHARDVLGKPPQDLSLEDLDPDLVGGFLNHLERERGNSARSRNTRLAAIRSLFRFAAVHEPHHAVLAQRILSIPRKRYSARPVDHLDRDETEALLRAPDPDTRIGRRDHALLLLAVQTGLRASELISLRRGDVQLESPGHLRCLGKGRKERCVPLRRDSIAALKAWMKESGGEPGDRVFANQRGNPLTHDSLAYLLDRNQAAAQSACPSLKRKRVTPHCLRHTAAMSLLQGGVDQATIALWLGHESVATTYIYLHADLKLKEEAMAKTTPLDAPIGRYRPEDSVLALLNSL